MLRIDRDGKSLSPLGTPRLAEVSITERYDLQELIANSPVAFFAEIGRELFVVGKEVLPSTSVQDRIDLLCIDKSGAVVVIELKRGNHKLHLLQAISYAAMISKWTADEITQLLNDEAQERLLEFLNVESHEINHEQKIVLIAEAFDYAVLASAEWLSEVNGIDIACCRISVAKDQVSGSEYLVCANVYPAPELVNQAVRRGRTRSTSVTWADWDEALKSLENPEVVSFFKRAIADGAEAYLRKRSVRFRVGGKRRWSVSARKSHAYSWQHGRFEGDVEYWKGGLSDASDVKQVENGQCLSFLLTTKDDYDFFRKSASTLQPASWSNPDREEVGGE
jgi:hypothetical protein